MLGCRLGWRGWRRRGIEVVVWSLLGGRGCSYVGCSFSCPLFECVFVANGHLVHPIEAVLICSLRLYSIV